MGGARWAVTAGTGGAIGCVCLRCLTREIVETVETRTTDTEPAASSSACGGGGEGDRSPLVISTLVISSTLTSPSRRRSDPASANAAAAPASGPGRRGRARACRRASRLTPSGTASAAQLAINIMFGAASRTSATDSSSIRSCPGCDPCRAGTPVAAASICTLPIRGGVRPRRPMNGSLYGLTMKIHPKSARSCVTYILRERARGTPSRRPRRRPARPSGRYRCSSGMLAAASADERESRQIRAEFAQAEVQVEVPVRCIGRRSSFPRRKAP